MFSLLSEAAGEEHKTIIMYWMLLLDKKSIKDELPHVKQGYEEVQEDKIDLLNDMTKVAVTISAGCLGRPGPERKMS